MLNDSLINPRTTKVVRKYITLFLALGEALLILLEFVLAISCSMVIVRGGMCTRRYIAELERIVIEGERE